MPGQITEALAAGIISETEAASLRDYDRKVMELISVDDFAPGELGTLSAQDHSTGGRPAKLGTASGPVVA